MDEDKISTKDIPSYHWPTKEEGKAQYPKFAKDFQGTLKGLRIVVEPGGIDRYLGLPPGRRPNNADERAEWLARTNTYQTKLDKVEMYCATALGVLEKSFPYGTTPRNIIDKASEKPVNVQIANWTYRRRFEACWEALRNEYQPSTVVDLKQLKDQISKLTDEGQGGFEQFQSEFHRLHAEIMATGVDDAVTERELNEIVRDGIKNHFVWVNVCYNLYRDNPNAPWRDTFTAVATALTSFRQKGFDPYCEAKSGPTISTTSTVAANAANAFPNKQGQFNNKRQANFTRDNSGRFQKQARTFATPTPNSSRPEGSGSGSGNVNFNPPSGSVTPDQTPNRCTRCWQPDSHSYKVCAEAKCACGQPLQPGQVICINYDNHPPTMKFIRKMPRFIETSLQSMKKNKTTTAPRTPQNTKARNGRQDSSRKVAIMSAQSTEEVRSAPSGEDLDQWD